MLSAADVYGVRSSRQPGATPTAEHAPGEPEPQVRTTARSVAGNPLLVLMVIIGLAVLLGALSVRGSFEVRV